MSKHLYISKNMATDTIENIERNYQPAWEGETEGGETKKIYTIVGPISSTTYRRLIDKDGMYLNDKEKYQLLAIKE